MHLAILLKLYGAVDEREQGVITCALYVLAGQELGAALTDDDRACGDGLTTPALDAAVLRVRVATVARRALTFLMCHGI